MCSKALTWFSVMQTNTRFSPLKTAAKKVFIRPAFAFKGWSAAASNQLVVSHGSRGEQWCGVPPLREGFALSKVLFHIWLWECVGTKARGRRISPASFPWRALQKPHLLLGILGNDSFIPSTQKGLCEIEDQVFHVWWAFCWAAASLEKYKGKARQQSAWTLCPVTYLTSLCR